MSLSRRALLKGGAAIGLAAGIPVRPLGLLFPAAASAGPATMATATTAVIAQSSFAACVNTPFRVTVGSKAVDITLTGVSPGVKPSATGDCFSLLFDGATTKSFVSNTYKVTHPSLGAFQLFVGPIGRPAKTTTHYEAVFTYW